MHNGSGSISYEEFLENLRDKIMNSIRERMVQEAFKKLDKDGSGCLTIEDLRGVCDVSGHPKILSGDWTEEQALEQFLCELIRCEVYFITSLLTIFLC